MQIPASHPARLLCASLASAALAFPAAAAAAPVTADLRVEAVGKALTDASFVTNTVRITTDPLKPACNGKSTVQRLAGPTATGVVVDAAARLRALRPVRLSDEFSFGLVLCGVGDHVATKKNFWLYKVNHVSPEVGGEQFAIKPGDEVLWYFQQTGKANTGDELSLTAPARARTGQSATVKVVAYDSKGAAKPAAGAKVAFPGGSATTDAAGVATVALGQEGTARLRATRGKDIPSNVARVCVADILAGCNRRAGSTIYGRVKADRIKGTPGDDTVSAGAGRDSIDVRRGGADRVRCGKGRDSVRTGRGDRTARDCEIVNGKPRGSG